MRRTLLMALLLLLTPLGPGAVGQDTAAAEVPWWNDQWHFRVPVQVDLQIASPLTGQPVAQGGRDYPVEVEIDIKEAVGRFVPFSRIRATLDEGSIRVVEHTPKPGGGHILREVPSIFLPGVYYSGTAPSAYAERIEGASSTYGTVRFALPGFTAPGQTRSFHVYFDLQEFGLKDPHPYTQTQIGRLESLYWKQPGHEFYVRMIGAETTYSNFKSVILPVATQDDTRYQIWDAETGTPWFDAPQRLDTYQYKEHKRPEGRGLGDQVVLRADKPVLAYHGAHHSKGDKPGFWDVSTGGGLAGTDFWMPSLWLNSMTVDVYFIAMERDATVTIQRVQNGEEVVLRTLQVPANSYRVWQNTDQYTVWHVTSTAPIMVQRPGTQTYQQLPSASGAPVGPVHYGAHSGQHGPDNAELTVVGFQAGPLDVYTLPDAPGSGLDLWRRAQHGAGFTQPFRAFDAPRPVMKAVGQADSVAFGSSRTGATQQPPGDIVFLGGRNAQEFYTEVPPAGLCACAGAIVFPFFPQTSVRIEQWDEQAAQWLLRSTALLGPGTENPRKEVFEVGPTRILSDKPVAIQLNTNPWHDTTGSSRGVFGDMLSGRLLPPATTLGGAEYRGCIPGLFDRNAPSAPSPSIRYVNAGDAAAFPMAVHNLAGGQSVELRYRIDLLTDETRRAALGWDITLQPHDGSGRSTELAHSASGAVDFTVGVLTHAASPVGSRLNVRVEASCADAPGFVFAYELRAQVRPQRGIDIEHVHPADQVRVVQPGATVHVPLRVTSLANLEETVDLTVANPLAAVGWTTSIQPSQIVLGPGSAQDVVLTVTAPPRDASTILRLTARAVSAGDPNTFDDAVTEVRINPRYAVGLSALEPRQEVLPGDTATFNLLVRNDGNGEHDVNVTFEGALPAGWEVVPPWRLLERMGIDQTRVVVVEVRTPGDARPHIPRTVQAAATSIGIDGTEFVAQQRLDLVTVVKQVHDLRVPPVAAGGTVDAQGRLSTGFTVSNAGNGDEEVRIRLGEGTPPGWQASLLQAGSATDVRLVRLPVAAGQEQALSLLVQVPTGTLAGAYEVVLEVLGGGDPKRISVPVTVPESTLIDARARQPVLETTPSQSRDFEVVVSNLGNVEETYSLEVIASDWGAEVFPPSMRLLPTQADGNTFTVTMVPPADLLPTVRERQFTFRVQGSSGVQAHVEAMLVVVRPDLRVEAVEPLEHLSPRGGFVHLQVRVHNDGEAQADQAVVRLYIDGVPYGAPEILQKIPNGGSMLAVFSIPESALRGGLHAVQVRVDPDGLIHESDEDNNVYQAFLEVPAARSLHAGVWLGAALGTVALAGGGVTVWRLRRR